MKREKLFSLLWAFLLSFALSAAATMCVVTAFRMGVDTGYLLRTCLVAALVSAMCYSLPLGLIPPGIGAVLLGYLWQNGTLENSVEAFLNRLTRQYDRAYSWGIIRWGHRVAEEMEPDILFCLCILGALIAMVCAWTVCRRRTVFPVMGLSLATIATCFVVTDTVPDSPWLYLLLLCFILLIMTGTVRRQEEKQGNRLCLCLMPVAALALLLLFAAIPRAGYSGQNAAKNLVDTILNTDSMQLLLGHVDNSTDANADTSTVDLSGVGYRVDTHAPVLQVTAPYTGTLYLRGRAMDVYDGVSWTQSGIDYRALYWPGNQLESLGELTVTTRFAHRLLYTPYYVTESDTVDISAGMLNKESLTEYSFSCRRSPSGAELSTTQGKQQNFDSYIQLDATVRKWAVPLTTRLFPSGLTTYQTAQAIASYVRNSASYNTRTPRMPMREKNFARWFLEESDTGYCVHFATAATVLLQAAGIPARFVTGYYAQVTEGETVTVYSDQSHAWAEYWLPGFGWTVLEATPPDFSDAQTQTEQTAPNATAPQSTQPARPEETRPAETPAVTPKKESGSKLWLLWVAVALCLLIAGTELQYRLRRRLRQKRLDNATPNQKALLYWQETVLCANLLDEQPDKGLYRLAEMAKFSQYTLTEVQLQQFETYLQMAQQKLRTHNIFKRIYYRFLLAIY